MQQTVPEQENRFWPMTICLRREERQHGRWLVDRWALAALQSDREAPPMALECQQRAADDGCDEYLWRGLSLQLHRDERAAYRFNLSSDDPRLFVVCNEEDQCMRPFVLTASQDLASSYMDGGEEDVFSVSMPHAIQCWIEAFIARHGEPDLMLGKGKRRKHGNRKAGNQSPEKGARNG